MTDSRIDANEILEGESTEYRAVSPAAIVSLVLGITAAAALFHPLGCVLAILGVVISIVALRRIASAGPELIGRKAALVGLTLSIAFGVSAPTQWATTRWWLASEAEPVGLQWFSYLQENKPEMAHQMTVKDPRPHEQVLNYYRNQPQARDELTKFVAQPLMRTLLALGDKAQVRLYETGEIIHDAEGQLIEQFYAVTYPDEQTRQPRTFFVDLEIDRQPHKIKGETQWRVVGVKGGVRPPSQQ